ncbi:MAG: M23 family metallopeptidase [Firmicutes bacterium]|nr:M23 family metallopeptidase [Bacillota bacterium]
MDCLLYPVRKIWISADYEDHGYNALDLGWWDTDPAMPEDTGRHPRLYAMADGIVTQIVNSHPDTPDWQGYGNFIIIKYPKLGYCSLYAHIKKDSFLVKVGETVKQLQPVCRMDNSGYSYGDHLHLEVCKGTSFTRHGGVDFIPIVYATDWHVVDAETQRDYNIRHMIIQPVIEDVAKRQVLVTAKDLRIRKAPGLSGETAGTALPGYYDVEETTEADGYTWAKVENYWIAANVEGDSELIEPKFIQAQPDETKDQAEITIDDLRIRLEPSTSSRIMGYAIPGFYDVEGSESSEDYVWLKVCGFYIACVDGVIFHAGKGDDKDEKIRELEAQVAELEEEIEKLKDQQVTDELTIAGLRVDMEDIKTIASRHIE